MRRAALLWATISLAVGMVTIPDLAGAQSNGRHDRRYEAINSGWDSRKSVDDWRNLEGTWYLGGYRDLPATIFSSRRGLTATNEFGQTTRLEITRTGNIRALDWEGGLRGTLRRDRIEWENGTTWMRQPTGRYARPR